MTPRLPDEMPQAMTESIAFVIAGSCVTRDVRQKHVGLAYRDGNSNVRLLHLGWHRMLFHEGWPGKYHWLELAGLDRELQETFADWAVIVAGAHLESPIPYSIIFRAGRNFDPQGHFIDLGDGSGLTCATFILALFGDFGLPLVDVSSWPVSRNGDFSWLRKILRNLKVYDVLKDKMPAWIWLEQARRRHSVKRFRPEEVFATAALYFGEPLHFSVVEPAGAAVNSAVPS